MRKEVSYTTLAVNSEGLKFEFVKGKIIPCLINTDLNCERLKDLVSRKFLDLSIVYRIVFVCNDFGITSTLIHKDMFSAWGISEEELYDLAFKNMKGDFSPTFTPIAEILNVPHNFMSVLTNKAFVYGAIWMTNMDVLDDISRKLDDNLYILPSSTNEVLIVGESCIDPDYSLNSIKETIVEINGKLVRKVDILSDHPYLYDRTEKKVISLI